MLTDNSLEQILGSIPSLKIGVVRDLFLDRYLDLDAAVTEPSIETGLDAYQVMRVRSYAGAAGTVINNLVSLGVQSVYAVSAIGDDGEGYELRQALARLAAVDTRCLFSVMSSGFRTPTYTKPMLHASDQVPRELNRLDIKNRSGMPAAEEKQILHALTELWPAIDALVV